MLVWVIYDISDDSIRNNIAKFCKGYGLYRVQKSAFLGDLNKNQIDELALRCEEIITEKDSVYVFPMCEDDFKKAKLIGKSFDKDLISNKIITKFF